MVIVFAAPQAASQEHRYIVLDGPAASRVPLGICSLVIKFIVVDRLLSLLDHVAAIWPYR